MTELRAVIQLVGAVLSIAYPLVSYRDTPLHMLAAAVLGDESPDFGYSASGVVFVVLTAVLEVFLLVLVGALGYGLGGLFYAVAAPPTALLQMSLLEIGAKLMAPIPVSWEIVVIAYVAVFVAMVALLPGGEPNGE